MCNARQAITNDTKAIVGILIGIGAQIVLEETKIKRKMITTFNAEERIM